MRKRVVLIALLLALLSLSACSKKQEPPKPDLETLYQSMLKIDGMPDMLRVSADQAEYIFGIMQSDCAGAITAMCADSLQADELWLVDAVDSAAADRIETLAKERLAQKGEETRDYLPDQYLVVQKGKVIRSGDRVCLLVSPQIDKLAELVG